MVLYRIIPYQLVEMTRLAAVNQSHDCQTKSQISNRCASIFLNLSFREH